MEGRAMLAVMVKETISISGGTSFDIVSRRNLAR
jgi:hypothetical protein